MSMEFLPEKELWRRFAVAKRARVAELVSMGVPEATAKNQASKEFSIYDRFEVDERGWMRISDLELPGEAPLSNDPKQATEKRRQSGRGGKRA